MSLIHPSSRAHKHIFGLKNLLGLSLLLGVSCGATGQHSHKAHTHGEAELLILAEGSQLQIELRSPAANITGFEHAAQNDLQRLAVTEAKQILTSEKLFDLQPKGCSAATVEADFSAIEEEHIEHEEHHGEDSDHEEHHGDHSDHSDEHSDIVVRYLYTCGDTSKLESITTAMMASFPSLNELHAQWVVGGRQGAATLDNSIDEIKLK